MLFISLDGLPWGSWWREEEGCLERHPEARRAEEIDFFFYFIYLFGGFFYTIYLHKLKCRRFRAER